MLIKIEGVERLRRYLGDLHQKQLPFAISLALNNTAEEARTAVIRQLQNNFTLRKVWWKPGSMYGINIKKAKKTNLEAEVFTRAPWMELHETGGVKLPKRRHLAIPSSFVRRSKKDLITKTNRPLALKDSFIRRGRSGQETIYQRLNKKQIRPMYFLEESAQIKPAFKFYQTAARVVAERWEQNAKKAIEFAIRTAK